MGSPPLLAAALCRLLQKAALAGTRQVKGALLASTATTVARGSFAPG